MSQQSDSTLDAAAIVIRDESILNANTPLRVGTWMKNLNDSKVNNLDLALKAAPEITKAALIALIAGSAVEKKPYKVTDSAYGIILVWGISATDISNFAVKLGNVNPGAILGYCGSYTIGTDTFTEQGRIPTAPTVTADGVHGFYVGQLLTTLDTGVTYKCTNASTGAAVWKVVATKYTYTSTDLTTAITNSAVPFPSIIYISDIGCNVYGLSANTISSEAWKDGSWDGTTWVQGSIGIYNGTNAYLISIRNDKSGNVFTGTVVNSNTLTSSGNNQFFAGSVSNNLTSSNSNKFEALCSTNILATSSGNYFAIASSFNNLTDSYYNKFGQIANSNILVGSTQNTFADKAASNNLLNCLYNVFGYDASSNTLGDGCQYITFGTKATNNTLGLGCLYNNYGNNAIYNTLGENCTYNTFEDFANQFVFADALSYCIIKAGLNGGACDFSAAAQLYGRSEYWSINKILGTNLIEITFDCNLPTAQTGTYATDTDVFTPYGKIVNFKKVLVAADIFNAGDFEIDECPAVSGAHWEIITQSVKLVGATTPYDGSPVLSIGALSATRQQFSDSNEVLSTGADIWSSLIPINALSSNSVINECFLSNKKLAVNISTASTSGDGTLTVYGTAVLIQD